MNSHETRNVAILAGQEPDLDPRISWAATYAPDSVDRTVFGIFDSRRARPDYELRNKLYTIRRFHRIRQTRLGALRWLFDVVIRRSVPDALLLLSILLAGLIFELPFVAAWAPVSFLRRFIRAAERLAFGKMRFVEPTSRPQKMYLSLRRLFQSVFHKLVLAREYINLRPNRILVFTDVAQYFFGTTRALLPELARESSKFDVLHANDMETLFTAVEAKTTFGAKVVYDAHEFWPHSEIGMRWWEVKFWEVVEGNLLRSVDRAFTVSSQLAKLMTDRYGITFGTIPNSEPNEIVVDNSTDHHAPPIIFVFQGGFAEKRGIEFILRAWKAADLEHCQLILRGPDSEYKNRCVRFAQSLGTKENSVLFARSVEESELLSAMSGCDVGIIPYEPYGLNYTYCCPNKLSQYMKCGLAILHNKLPYVAKVVGEANCGWAYSSDDLEGTVETLKTIATDMTAIKKAGRNARHYFNQYYNWQAVSSELYRSYEK